MKKTILTIILLITSLIGFSQVTGGAGNSNGLYISNTKYINSVNDLPELDGGEYVLDSLTNYVLNTQINISNPIRLQNGTTLRGSAVSLSRVIYTGDGAALRATDASITLRSMQLIATGGTNTCVFNFQNDDQTKNSSILECFILNSDSIGCVKGFDNTTFINNVLKENSKGIVIDSTYAFAMANCYFQTKEGTPCNLINFPANSVYESLSISSCIFDAENTGDTLLYFGNINVEFSTITGCSFKESTGVSIYGINASNHPEIKFYGNNNIENYTILYPYTQEEIAGIPNPPRGMMVGNSTDTTIAVYTGIEWKIIPLENYYVNWFTEDFSSGSFATNGWTTVQSTTNLWYVGTATSFSDTYSAYISNDGGTSNTYTNTTSRVSHLYIDILLPSSANDIQLTFKWKCSGEVGYDYGRVYYAPTSVTPVANTQVNSTYLINGDLNNRTEWQTFGTSIGADDVGTTMRFIISWINDGSLGTNPPIAIDDFKINYE